MKSPYLIIKTFSTGLAMPRPPKANQTGSDISRLFRSDTCLPMIEGIRFSRMHFSSGENNGLVFNCKFYFLRETATFFTRNIYLHLLIEGELDALGLCRCFLALNLK